MQLPAHDMGILDIIWGNCLNNTHSKVTRFTPYEIIHGGSEAGPWGEIRCPTRKRPCTRKVIATVRKRIKTIAYERENRYNQGKCITYEVNRKILIKQHPLSSSSDRTIRKFFPKYKGPYTIYKIVNDSVIYARSSTEQIVQNVCNVRPFKALLNSMSLGYTRMSGEEDILRQIDEAMLEFEKGPKPLDMDISTFMPDDTKVPTKIYPFHEFPPTAHKRLKTRVSYEEKKKEDSTSTPKAQITATTRPAIHKRRRV